MVIGGTLKDNWGECHQQNTRSLKFLKKGFDNGWMTLVGLGWMLTKKITLGRKEGHKIKKPFLKALLRYPKVEREPSWEPTLFDNFHGHAISSYGTLLFTFLPQVTPCFFIQKKEWSIIFFTLLYLLLLYSKKKWSTLFLPQVTLLLLYFQKK